MWGQVLYTPISPSFPALLKKTIRSFRPDLLHFHLPNMSAFWSLFIAEARSIPWVVYWHSDVVASKIDQRMVVAYALYRPFERQFLRHTHCVVATSRPYLTTSRALAPFGGKCRVVPLGLDPTRLKRPEEDSRKWAEEKWGGGGTRVLAIGRLTYYKGHEVLIRATLRTPDARVFIVGEGERRSRLEGLIRQLGLGDRVKLPGFLEESRLHAMLAACDCLCLPSVERTEAFGLVLLEAMRYGRPVVASDVAGSGIGWVVRQGETGLLVPPGDPVGLSKALRVMGERSGLREGMGHAAKRRFDEVFQIDKVAKKIGLIYQEILRSGV